MVNFCLPPEKINNFIKDLKSGDVDTDKLSNMKSADRNEKFAQYFGKDAAKQLNAEFESKLLLKNQNQGMASFIKNVAGLSPAAKRDYLSKVNNLTKVLDPADKEKFLADITSRRLGADLTPEEYQNVAELAKNVNESKITAEQSVEKNGYTKASEDARLQAGAAKVTFEKYISDVKGETNRKSLKQSINPTNWINATKSLLGATKGLVASFTSHAPLKHGFMALFEDPKSWLKNYVTQFSDAAKEIKGENVMDAIRAEGYSRENSMNGVYDKWIPGELSKTNEEYHSNLPAKIPVLGRLYSGSKTMFDGFNLKMRMDLVDHYVNIVKKMGLDPQDADTAKAWGKLAIDQTGGKTTNPDNALGFFLFSQRLLKAEANNLTLHLFDKTATTAVKIQSAKTLAKAVAGVAAVMATANAIKPGTVELDPRSSNAGKIKIGDTRFDIEGGYGSMITLGARIAAAISGNAAIKSSSTGVLSSLGSGIGQTSYGELIGDFLQGRGSPVEQIISDLANGQTYAGTKPTPGSEIGSLVTPIPVSTYQQLTNDPNSANTLAVMIAQQLGLMSNTYGAPQKGQTPTTKSGQAFENKVGSDTYLKASQEITNEENAFENSLANNSKYQSLSEADKTTAISKEKTQIQKDVMAKYGFKYKAPKANKNKFNGILSK